VGEYLQVCNSITFCASLRLCTCSCFCRRSLGRGTWWVWRPPVGGAVSRHAPDHCADAGPPPRHWPPALWEPEEPCTAPDWPALDVAVILAAARDGCKTVEYDGQAPPSRRSTGCASRRRSAA
jgi:hypothetical protein